MKTITTLAKIGIIVAFIGVLTPAPASAQQALSVYCLASPSSVNSNDQVTFTAYASGGNGSYAYIWSGSDNLTGGTQSVSHRYPYVTGQQEATVLVFSGSLSQSARCTVNVNQTYNNNYNYNNNNYNNLTANCYATPPNVGQGDEVNWIGSATGGNVGYTYSWTGTDGLYGTNDHLVKSYSYDGQKTGTFTVYSNGQSVSATCLANVNYTGNQNYFTQYPQYPVYGNQASGVFLSQVPYTGGGLSLQVFLFVLGLFTFSSFGAYLVVINQKSKALKFKLANQKK